MIAFPDDYYERVSVRFGLLRIGPRRQRLTRAEWQGKKRQAAVLAQAHADVQTFASNMKAAAKSRIAAREAEADQAAQAKIDAITTQSHQRITMLKHKAMMLKHKAMMLKHKAIERIIGLKDHVNELEGAMSEKDALIAAQAAELEAVMGVPRENGVAPNFGI